MKTARLEAFSDGVIAIILTIMVLELKVPHGTDLEELLARWPTFVSYVLSFVLVAIIWVNHHHMLHIAQRADAGLLWANNHLLFWMSLIPFATAYIGENHALPLAVALYGGILTFVTISYTLLRHTIACQHPGNAQLAEQHCRSHRKNYWAIALYGISIPCAYVSVYISFAIFILIPCLYFLPEKRLEKVIE